ncbi:MAG: SPW repeat protein [Spirochaetaceae bacterium]|nr:SPW repeat protein [Spirochaetaceae bacterium]
MKIAKLLSWGIALAGLWEILAPFIIGYSSVTGAMANAVIFGIILLGFGIFAALTKSQGSITVLSWLNTFLGLWIILAPFVLSYNRVTGAVINDIIIGIVVAFLGFRAAIAPWRMTS